MKRHLFWYLIWIACLTSCSPTTDQAAPELNPSLPAAIDSMLVAEDFSGVVLIARDTTVLLQRSMGFSDLEAKEEMRPDEKFVVGSISKQLTAALVLREYEKGKMKLTDSLGTYLEGMSYGMGNQITVHHLLAHTHGIVELDQPLAFEPGAQFAYSQLGYDLLARVLEKVTGKSFRDLSTELFRDLEMNAIYHPDDPQMGTLALGYEESESGELSPASNSLRNYPAAGSFVSTAQDLLTWTHALHSGEVLQDSTLTLMKSKKATRIHPIFGELDYGYGLLYERGEENIQIGALGYAPGFVSACYYYPASHMTLVVLSNVAQNLDDFRETFRVHTEAMELVKQGGTIAP